MQASQPSPERAIFFRENKVMEIKYTRFAGPAPVATQWGGH
jgi:hypothetical protein